MDTCFGKLVFAAPFRVFLFCCLSFNIFYNFLKKKLCYKARSFYLFCMHVVLYFFMVCKKPCLKTKSQ